MKNKIFNPISVIALTIFILISISYSQTNGNSNNKIKDHKPIDKKIIMDSCKMMMDKEPMPDSCKMMMKNSEHKKMMKNMKDKMNMKGKTKMKTENSIVREGVIDLVSIDQNKDGKVFQDAMDWNVISDNPGKCPLCGMKLKEVSLEKAKENLLNNGFEVN